MLRQKQDFAPPGATLGFAMMPDDAAPHASEDEAGRRRSWRQADVRRAINAAEKAGLGFYRVEISPDGTISIVVGAQSESAGER